MIQDKDQMRAEFEKWARSFGTWDVQRDDEPNFRVESYTEMEVSIAWHAWQAARASANEQIVEMAELIDELRLDRDVWKHRASAPQGVPSEPSDEDIDAVFNAMPDGAHGWLITWGYRQFARALLQRWGGKDVGDVEAMVEMMEANEWADHVGATDLGERLEHCISTLQNELHAAKQDAERMNWIANNDAGTIRLDGKSQYFGRFVPSYIYWGTGHSEASKNPTGNFVGPSVRSAIDAAMAEQKGEQ